MSNDTTINEACKTAQMAGFSIDSPGFGEVSSDSGSFMSECTSTFKIAAEMQRRYHPRQLSQLWDKDLIRKVSRYAAAKHIPVLLSLGVPNSTPFSTNYRAVVLSLSTTATIDDRALEYALRHESGHLNDFQNLQKVYPQLKKVLSKNATLDEAIAVIEAYFNFIRKNIPKQERTRFDRYYKEFFGETKKNKNLKNLMNIFSCVTELVRFGEEILKGESEDILLSPNYSYFTKSHNMQYCRENALEIRPGFYLDLMSSFQLAQLKEAGVWEKFQKRQDFDPAPLGHLQEEFVDFFRMCIRASKSYFQTRKLRK